MERVAGGVHQINGGGNAFIVDGDEGVTPVDAGLPRRHPAILAGIEAIGRKPSDVRAVVVTHAHVDHVGGLAGWRHRGRSSTSPCTRLAKTHRRSA